MKYIIVVNQKFIVTVDAESNGGAEHKILDNFSGIIGAQAFSQKELKTDYFKYFLENCSTISLNELGKLSDDVYYADEEYKYMVGKLNYSKSLVEDLEKSLEKAKLQVKSDELCVAEKLDKLNATLDKIR